MDLQCSSFRVLTFLLLLPSTLSLTLLKNGTALSTYNSPKWRAGPMYFDVRGSVKMETTKAGACALDTAAQGYVILAGEVSYHKCSYETLVRSCKSVGCLGVIFRASAAVSGREMHGYWWESPDGMHDYPPLVSLAEKDWDAVAAMVTEHREANPSNNNTDADLTVWIPSSDLNPWATALNHPLWHLARAVLCCAACLNVGIAVYKLKARFVAARAWLAIFCLSLEAISNSLRFMYLALDPLHSTRVMSFPAGTLLMGVSIPLNLLAAVLVSLFWMNMTQEAQKGRVMGSFLAGKFKYFAIGFAVLLVVLEVTANVAGGLFLVSLSNLRRATGPMAQLLTWGVSIFMVIAGIRVWRYLSAASVAARPLESAPSSTRKFGTARRSTATKSKKKTSSQEYSKRLVIFIICSCIFRVTMTLGGMLLSLVQGIGVRIFSFILFEVSISLVGTFQILVFTHSNRSSSKSSTRPNSSSRSHAPSTVAELTSSKRELATRRTTTSAATCDETPTAVAADQPVTNNPANAEASEGGAGGDDHSRSGKLDRRDDSLVIIEDGTESR